MQTNTLTALQAALKNNTAYVEMKEILEFMEGPGKRFHVNSTGGADTFEGSKNAPLATIQAAVDLCEDSRGDVIIVSPNHAEAFSAAAGIIFNKIGITVIGQGNGPITPTITLDTDVGADIDITAAGVTLVNLHFVANFQDIAVCLDVNADDFTIRGCRFTDNSATLNFKVCVQPGSANQSDRLKVLDCSCICKGAANTHFINFSAAQDGCVIRGNHLMGNWETMCIGGAGIVTYASILDNVIFNEVTDADHCINMGATATGVAAGNMVTGGHATAGIVPGDLGSLENYYEGNTTDFSGSLEPNSS